MNTVMVSFQGRLKSCLFGCFPSYTTISELNGVDVGLARIVSLKGGLFDEVI